MHGKSREMRDDRSLSRGRCCQDLPPTVAANVRPALLRDTQIEKDVQAALRRDPRIKHPELIAVSADGIGTVVLRGAVESIHQRLAAVHDATHTDRVFEVIADDLRIHPPLGARRADDEIRAAVMQRLNEDSWARFDHVDVKVAHGRVKLTGYVRNESQSAAAAQSVESVAGVVEVTNQIEVH